MNLSEPNNSIVPQAEKVEHSHQYHNESRVDNYQWLRDDDRADKKVLDYLSAENKYTDAQLSSHKTEIENIYHEIIARLPHKESTVPSKIDDYWYYSRYDTGNEYEILARKKHEMTAEEEIILDMNLRAENQAYYYSNYQEISPNHQILAFSEDTSGDLQYTLYFKDLNTGTLYKDKIENTSGEVVWALDNKTIFYIKKHPVTLLGYQVYRHKLASNEEDVLVYEEKDNSFYLGIGNSTSRNYLYIMAGSTTSSEVLYLHANKPNGEFMSFLPRESNHEYSVEEFNNEFYILTNWQAHNFRVMKTSLEHSNNRQKWQEVIAHDKETLIYDLNVFSNYIVLEQRNDGILHLKVINRSDGSSKLIQSKEQTYTMWLDYNPQQNTDVLRYSYASMPIPFTVYEYDMQTEKQKILKRDEIATEYNPDDFHSEKLLVKARDGEMVPVSLVYKKSAIPLGLRPLLVYGYGSYGSSVDPTFSYSRISLLNRGFIYAIAHVRGSQAKGRQWYEDGKLLKKKNTFTDFVDVTKGLLEKDYGDKNNVFAVGGSAGGLLMGVIANTDGMLYKGIIAQVPFVDVITTMLDEDIPLTTGEFDEWGNPKIKEFYDYMMSYSPYDNVKKQNYPNMLVTTGLNDTQVQYWEPAKWVAKLRDMKTNNNLLLLRTNMDAGHGGTSGRYQQYKEVAEEYGFLIKLISD